MLELVETVLATTQSDAFKANFAKTQIMKTVAQPMTTTECKKIFLKLTDWVVTSKYKILRENALKGYNALTKKQLLRFC